MPFASSKQKKLLWMKKPKLAAKWSKKYGSEVVSKLVKNKRKKNKLV